MSSDRIHISQEEVSNQSILPESVPLSEKSCSHDSLFQTTLLNWLPSSSLSSSSSSSSSSIPYSHRKQKRCRPLNPLSKAISTSFSRVTKRLSQKNDVKGLEALETSRKYAGHELDINPSKKNKRVSSDHEAPEEKLQTSDRIMAHSASQSQEEEGLGQEKQKEKEKEATTRITTPISAFFLASRSSTNPSLILPIPVQLVCYPLKQIDYQATFSDEKLKHTPLGKLSHQLYKFMKPMPGLEFRVRLYSPVKNSPHSELLIPVSDLMRAQPHPLHSALDGSFLFEHFQFLKPKHTYEAENNGTLKAFVLASELLLFSTKLLELEATNMALFSTLYDSLLWHPSHLAVLGTICKQYQAACWTSTSTSTSLSIHTPFYKSCLSYVKQIDTHPIDRDNAIYNPVKPTSISKHRHSKQTNPDKSAPMLT